MSELETTRTVEVYYVRHSHSMCLRNKEAYKGI
jgi:hypothetical protein